MSIGPELARVAAVRASAARQRLRQLVGIVRRRTVEARQDSIMAANRLTAGALMFGATWYADGSDLAFRHWRAAILIWIGLGVGLLVHIWVYPRAATLRRCLAMVVDIGGGTTVMHFTGEAGAFVWPAYLWIIVGNGLRFGGAYILLSSLLCTAGFALVIATTPFWRTHLSLTAALLVALLVLPGYAYLLVRQLAAARAAAERASHFKTMFLAGVSHELRTPLHAITGFAELLKATKLDPDQGSMVRTIETSADALLAMIERLLDVSRIEAGALSLSLREFELTQLLADVAGIIGVQVEAKGLRLNTFVTARTPLALHSDEARLREVLLNLCANAVKFTTSGDIIVAVDGEPGPNGVILRVEVSDTGIGIDDAAQGHIFEMFAQADDSIAARFGGTGMGLALCATLVRALGGRLGVTSDPGCGSTFWFTVPAKAGTEVERLPLVHAPVRVVTDEPSRVGPLLAGLQDAGLKARIYPHAALAVMAPTPSPIFLDAGNESLPELEFADGLVPVLVQGQPTDGLPTQLVRARYATVIHLSSPEIELRRAVCIAAARSPVSSPQVDLAPSTRHEPTGMRVLVADDSPVNRKVARQMLEHAGHEVVDACDGEQALALLCEGAADVALLDVNMPLLSGIEVAQFYAFSAPGDARVPLLGLTADGTPATSDRCLAAGMAACLTKPLRSAALLEAVQDAFAAALQQRSGSRPTAQSVTDAAPVPPLDLEQLANLASVSSEQFVAEILREFVQQTDALIPQLEVALLEHDVSAVRDRAHAICSSAGNIGAAGIRALCSPWQAVSAAELEQSAHELIDALHAEWARSRTALLERARSDVSGS